MTHEVAKKKPNKHGLNDMLGNVWEYCSNPFDEKEPGRAVLRGGSWKDPASSLTPGNRLAFDDDWVILWCYLKKNHCTPLSCEARQASMLCTQS